MKRKVMQFFILLLSFVIILGFLHFVRFGGLTGFVILTDSVQGDFNSGTYTNTEWNGSAVVLTAGQVSGSYVSRVFDAGSSASWNNLSFIGFYKSDLPDNQGNDGVIDMSSNTLLLHLDESSGSFSDSSGNGNTGSANGALAYGQEGIFGSAVGVDSNNEYISVSHSSGLVLDDDYSVEIWIKPASGAAQWKTFFEKTNQFSMDLIGSDKVRFQISGYTNVDSSASLVRDEWNHVVGVLDNTDSGNDLVKIYVNGQLSGTYGPNWGTPGTGTDNLFVGGVGASDFVEGTYDEVAVYQGRVLSDSEILERYKRGVIELNASARSCDDSSCSGEVWEDIEDASVVNLTVNDNQYFQYKFDFSTSDGSYTPLLESVSVDYTQLSFAPTVDISSPSNGSTLEDNQNINLNFSVSGNSVDSCWYSIDYESNVSLSECGNTTFSVAGDGNYTLVVYANDSDTGEIGQDSSSFEVAIPNTAPSINVVSPSDGESFGTNESLALDYVASDVDDNLDSCWYNLDEGENITLANCQNTTFDVSEGSHTVYVYVNDTKGEDASDSVSFSVDVGAPAISLSSPLSGASSSTGENVEFVYTAVDGELDSCQLWSDLSGSFELVETDSSVISGVESSFFLNLSDGSYSWNVWCNDTLGNSAFNGNRSLIVDSVDPAISLSQPSGAKSSRTGIPLEFSVNDSNVDSCLYNVYKGASLEVANTSVDCFSGSSSFSVTVDADFVLNFYANDSAGNSKVANSTFSVSTVSSGGSSSSSSGGGGGGGSGFIVSPSTNDTKEISASIISLSGEDVILKRGTSKKISFEVENKERIFLNKCSLVGGGDLAGFISGSPEKGLSPGEKFTFDLDLGVPESQSPGVYSGSLVLECEEGNYQYPFKVVTYRNSFEAEIGEHERDGNELSVVYSLKEFSREDHILKIAYELVDFDGVPRASGVEEVVLGAGYSGDYKLVFDLPKDTFGEFNLTMVFDDGSSSVEVSKPVFLPSREVASGLAVSEIDGKRGGIWAGVFAFVILLLIIARAIYKRNKRGQKLVHNFGKKFKRKIIGLEL